VSELARLQAVLARFLVDRDFEARVRAAPDRAAREVGIDLPEMQSIARIAPDRVEAFRRSRLHKEEVRAGKVPRRI
jgi:hypothetical protein